MQVVPCCIIASFALLATAHGSNSDGLLPAKIAGEQSSDAMSAIVRRTSHQQDKDSHLWSKVKT